jgi:hypothetical protein
MVRFLDVGCVIALGIITIPQSNRAYVALKVNILMGMDLTVLCVQLESMPLVTAWKNATDASLIFCLQERSLLIILP